MRPRAEASRLMDILYLLIPLSVRARARHARRFAWALHGGQFDDLEREGERILDDDDADKR